MPVLEPDSLSSYDKIISTSAGKLIVIDFYATWCGPCKIMSPKFTKLSAEFNDVVFVKVDVDAQEEIVARHSITVMPTFVFMKNGKQIDVVEGAMDEQLRAKLVALR